jgi:16S rRNA (guanine1207-N2)-methyltransferase
VLVAADLWDVPGRYQTLLYPVPEKGERSLKLDMIEQAYHTLQSNGTLIVLSPYEKDDLFRTALKKVFGSGIHEPNVECGSLFWCQRSKEHPRRRHEIVFQVRTTLGRSLRFISRPGVFSYGRLDAGARALVETMEIGTGERVLDMGCGIGSNGIHAALQSGPEGETVFLDSNLRAVALAELNATNAGLTNFRTVAASGLEGLEHNSFDVVLANPPYYGQGTIAERFILDALEALRPGGRLYLVTRQLEAIGTIIAETFGEADAIENRGYVVLCASK